MDSLLASYASSSDEEQQHRQRSPPQPSVSAPLRSQMSEPSASRSSALLSYLPPPKSSSLFQSQPKQCSQPSMPTGFFEDGENEDVVEGDSRSAARSEKLQPITPAMAMAMGIS